MKFLTLILFISICASAKDILIIGDSHMAGVFGKELYRLFSTTKNNTVVLGHASSAPIQWIGVSEAKLSGGVFNKAYINGRHLKNPNPTDWREKVAVPLFAPLLRDFRYHTQWRRKIRMPHSPDTVIVELGANDAKAIADSEGNIYQSNYEKRLEYMKELIDMIIQNGSQCIFVTPPNGMAKSQKRVQVLYSMILKAASGKCDIYKDSIKYVASGKETNPRCDGYHFWCTQADKNKAKNWAKEVFEFAKESGKL